ncbi:MAG: hypothetical protein DWH94_06810, partial [Planctomycetota bacterium]
ETAASPPIISASIAVLDLIVHLLQKNMADRFIGLVAGITLEKSAFRYVSELRRQRLGSQPRKGKLLFDR